MENITLNKTCFSYRDSQFRIDNFYFIYEKSNGERVYILCNREDANAVSGSGVCGIIAYFSEIEIIEKESKILDGFSEEELKDYIESNNQDILEDSKKLLFYKSLPSGLSTEEIIKFRKTK